MSAKRFRLGIDNKNGVGLFDGEIRLLYIRFNNIEDTVSCEDALNHHCNLMNELHEENQELRLQLNSCSDQRNEFHRGARENANRVGKLKKENEELKEALKELKEIGDYQAKRINELNDENEQLKKEKESLIKGIKDTAKQGADSITAVWESKNRPTTINKGYYD